MGNNIPIITSKTLFWLTSLGTVARERPSGDRESQVFCLGQLMSGKDVAVAKGWRHGYPYGICLAMDGHGRIIRETFNNALWFQWMERSRIGGIIPPLPARMRKLKVVADNLSAFARMFGARYDNSLYE